MAGKRIPLLAFLLAMAGVFSSTLAQGDADALLKKGLALYNEGKYQDSIIALKQAITLNSSNAEAFYHLGNAYRQSEQVAEAIGAYLQALTLKPKSAEALYGLGVAYGMSGKPNEAMKCLKQSIELKQDNPKAHYNLGVALLDLGKDDEAIEEFKESARLNPKDVDSFFNLGAAYSKRNRLKEAEMAFARAIELNPRDDQARYQIALVYLAMGNRGLAIIHQLALQETNPDLAKDLAARMVGSGTSSLVGRRVVFVLPSNWQVQKQEDGKESGRLQLVIPYAATDGTPHSANAVISAEAVPEKFTVKDHGDRVYRNKYDGMAVVNDIPDGVGWRTIVWTARSNDLPYLSLERFGVVNGIAVEFLVSFPLFEKGDQEWMEKTIADFNEVCVSLKIDGTNSTQAKVFIDKLPLPQKK